MQPATFFRSWPHVWAHFRFAGGNQLRLRIYEYAIICEAVGSLNAQATWEASVWQLCRPTAAYTQTFPDAAALCFPGQQVWR